MPATVTDLYAVLGVGPDASRDEIAARYRVLAKELHPDANPDPPAAERFKAVALAYRVLTNPAARARYDARRRPATTTEAPRRPGPSTRPVRRFVFTRRWGIAATVAGVVSLLLAASVGVLVVALRHDEAALRARGVASVAAVVEVGGQRRLEFTTVDGRLVRAPEPRRTGSGDNPVGSRVELRYDPDDPTEVVVERSTFGRDVTLGIVAAKLLVGGVVLLVVGGRRLRRA